MTISLNHIYHKRNMDNSLYNITITGYVKLPKDTNPKLKAEKKAFRESIRQKVSEELKQEKELAQRIAADPTFVVPPKPEDAPEVKAKKEVFRKSIWLEVDEKLKEKKKLHLTLSKKDILLFDATIEDGKIKVNSMNTNTNDSFLELFLSASIANNILIIPKFVKITLENDKMSIDQESTFPQMFPCTLSLNTTNFISINNLSVADLVLQNGKVNITGTLITNKLHSVACDSYRTIAVVDTGTIQAKEINLDRFTFAQSGKILVSGQFQIKNSIFHNYGTGVMDIADFNLSNTSHENHGYMNTRKFNQISGSFINQKSGTWDHIGIVEFGTMSFQNHGTITWKNTTHDTILYDMAEGWTFSNLVAKPTISITNNAFGVIHLKDSKLIFDQLINNGTLIVSSGQYTVNSLQNNGLISFLDSDFTFTDQAKVNVPNYLTSTKYGPMGKIESEKALIYDIQKLPDQITTYGNITFSERHRQFRTLADLDKIKSSSLVTFLCPAITLAKNIEIIGITYLTLKITGNFTNPGYVFKTSGLRLEATGSVTNGSSNTSMGSILAIHNTMTIIADNINNQYGKIYGKGETWLKATKGDILNGIAISKGPFLYGLNGSYIASNGTLRIDTPTEFKNAYGQVYSHGKQIIETQGKITNLAGEITCGNDITFVSKVFTNTRDAVYLQAVANWTWAYTNCSHHFESSDQAFVRSLGSIYFKVDQGTNLASSIVAQQDIHYYTKSEKKGGLFGWLKNNGSYKPEMPPTFTSSARHNYGWGCNDKQGYQQSNSPVNTHPSTIQAGQSIKIDTGSFTISSNMNSPVIAITANNGHFNNTVRHRKNVNCQATIFVDLTQLIQQQIASKKGFLKLTSKGKVKSDLGNKKAILNQSSVMLVTEDNQHLYDLPFNRMNILNPLQNMPSDFLNLFIQSTLSEVAGKVHIKDLNGQSLAKKLLSNADLFQQETHKALVNKKDLYQRAPYAMILQELKKVNDVLQSNTILCVPPEEICEFQSEGDIVADEFSCITENDQIHSNNRIVARDILDVISKKGSVKRQTESYTSLYDTDGLKIIEDIAMPKQTFVCLNGDVNVTAHKNVNSVGVDTYAKRDFNETAQTGDITNDPLILHKTVETKHDEGNSIISTTEVTERTTTLSAVQSIAKANRHITKTAVESISQTATIDKAGEKIEYNAKSIDIASAILVGKTENINETSGPFTEKRTYESQDTATVALAEISAPKIIFKGNEAELKGCNINGYVVEDHTEEGLKLKPLVKQLSYFKQMTVDSPLASSDVGCKGGQEVMVPCKLAIDKLVRMIDNKEMVLESVEWDKNRTEIIGKFTETTRELKQWHTSWAIHKQAIPDGALVVVSLAVSFATYGTGAVLCGGLTGAAGAMCSAGFTTLCNVATTSLLKTGDPLMAAKSILSEDFCRSLAISVASAGLCEQFNLNVRPDSSASIIDFAKYNAMKAIVNVPLCVVIGGHPIEEVLKGELVNCAIDSVSQYSASQIGHLYREDKLSFPMHKLSHAVSGGVTGAVTNMIFKRDVVDGALSGAIGAAVSEIAGEINPFDTKDINARLFTSKAIAGTVALLLKQDVNLAVRTATTTVENNLWPCLLAALTALGATHTVKDVIDAFNEDGLDAAIDTLIIHGILLRVEKGVVHYGGKAFAASKELWKKLPTDKMKDLWKAITGNKYQLDPKSVINRDLLYHQLQIQEKLGEIGTPFAGGVTGVLFRNEDRIVKQYGGEMGDWVKSRSTDFTSKAGQDIRLHWVENLKTGQRVEYKQKLIN